MEYDWCDPNDQANLNMANSFSKVTSHICFKGIENYTLEGFGQSM